MFIVSVKSKNGQDLEKPFVTNDYDIITDAIRKSAETDCFVIVDPISVR